jgi:cytochrome b
MLIWNKFIRFFHLFLVLGILIAYLSEDFETLHEIVGYFVLIILVVRINYGFITKDKFAKLSGFFHSPKKIFSFIKSVLTFKEERYLGHNPLAGLVMFSIFLTIFVSVFSGIFGFAMKEEEGFASGFITPNFEFGEKLLELHEVSTDILLILIILHLIGVIISSILTKENLAKSIFIHGKKRKEK